MKLKKTHIKTALLTLLLLLTPSLILAAVTPLTANSWDDAGGLAAAVSPAYDRLDVAGARVSQVAWGQGPLNYMAGATANSLFPGNGELTVDLIGIGAGGVFGAGTGYKAWVQFYNDPQNVIAMGVIQDPGLSPNGITVMVEGLAHGQPVGGYWMPGSSPDISANTAANITVQWTPTQISWTIDRLEAYRMTYPIQMNNPSISFLGAARMPGDSVSVRFQNIVFSNTPSTQVSNPTENPRATISADVNFVGGANSVGWAAKLNLHDAYGNAISLGAHADINDLNSLGVPYFHFDRVRENIGFDHGYVNSIRANQNQTQHWDLFYYDQAAKAVFFLNGVAVGEVSIKLRDRIFFQVGVDGAQNGDYVRADFSNVSIGGTWADGRSVRPNGDWNDVSFDFWGLNATRTGGSVNSANFRIEGTVAGLPAGADWDTIETTYGYAGQPVAAVAMITEWWYNQ